MRYLKLAKAINNKAKKNYKGGILCRGKEELEKYYQMECERVLRAIEID